MYIPGQVKSSRLRTRNTRTPSVVDECGPGIPLLLNEVKVVMLVMVIIISMGTVCFELIQLAQKNMWIF